MEKSLSLEIDNFSERNDVIMSDPVSSGGCEWCLKVYPKGDCGSDHLSLYLCVASHKSLRHGWKRRASCYFVLLNQSGDELYRSPDEGRCLTFCAEVVAWGFKKTMLLTKLQEKGFLENNKLTIEVYIKVHEVVHQGKSSKTETLDFNGFHVLLSQVASVDIIFDEHPDFAINFKPKNQGVKTAMLLGLVETLSKSPRSLSLAELSDAQSELTELTEAGFELDWLESKLEEVFVERKKALADGSWVQELEERVKNVELTLSDLQDEMKKQCAAQVYSFEFIDFFIKRFFLSCFSISKY